MNYSRLSIVVVIRLIFFTHPASAQSQAAKPKAPLDNAAGRGKSVTKTEADRIRKVRQEQARSLLFALSAEARGFRDQKLRARSLARISFA